MRFTREPHQWEVCMAGAPVSSPLAPLVMATVHPSSLLRAPDDETRQRETRRFIEDLRAIAKRL